MALLLDATEMFDRVRDALAPTYEIHREIGRGGMSVVYLATDLKHGRQVALKVLDPKAASTVGSERFVREIRFAAKLSHPHILPVLDSGSCLGLPFYSMPYVEGESLRSLLDKGKVPLDLTLAIARDLADALHYAHAAGIVHRDIKPENILLVGDQAVLADFGIARALGEAVGDSTLTMVGITIGTPAYMSPEQVAGDGSIDGRTDIYSLALVLFEMFSGSPPFAARTGQGIMAQKLVENAPLLSTKSRDILPHIDRAIAWALSRDPDDRPSTARQFALALLELPDTPGRITGPRASQPRPVIRGSATLGMTSANMRSIAVLPFANLSSNPENEFFCDGLTEEIIGALGRLRTMRVLGRTSSFALKGHRLDAREAGTRLRVSTVVDGSVRRIGNRVRMTAQLIDVETGFELWSDRLDRDLDDAFALQDEMAHAIATTLTTTLVGGVAAAPASPVPGPAYETYLRGRFALGKRTDEHLRTAVQLFREVVEQAPDFALGWNGLGESLLLLAFYGAALPEDVMPYAKQAAERALTIDPTLAEAHSMIGTVCAAFEWSWSAAAREFERALALGPRSASVYQRYALDYLVPLGRVEEARAAIDRALVLEPLSAPIQTGVGVVRHYTGDIDAAVTELSRTVGTYPDFVIANYFLAGALRDRGDYDAALLAIDRGIALAGGTGSPEMISARGQILARMGDIAAAQDALAEVMAAATAERSTYALEAQVLVAVGAHAPAIEALERAADHREAELIYLDARPMYAPLRGDPQFQRLRARVGLAVTPGHSSIL